MVDLDSRLNSLRVNRLSKFDLLVIVRQAEAMMIGKNGKNGKNGGVAEFGKTGRERTLHLHHR